MSGFIALHREAFAHPLLKDGDRFRAWFWLVANAAWKPTKHDARGTTITVDRGQICAGRDYLAKAWGWSASAVERFLTRLETEHMIERTTGQIKTVITICNYEKYQDVSDEPGQLSGQQTGQKPDRNRTAKEQGKQGNKVELEANAPNSRPRGRKRAAPEIPNRPDDVSEQVWRDFLQHRERLDADLSVTALAGFRREATEVGWTLEKAISESILRGWRGFKAKWVNDNDRSNANRNSSSPGARRSGLATAIDDGIAHIDAELARVRGAA